MRINLKSVLIAGVGLGLFACSGNPRPDEEEVIPYDFEKAIEEALEEEAESEDIEYYVEVIEGSVEVEEIRNQIKALNEIRELERWELRDAGARYVHGDDNKQEVLDILNGPVSDEKDMIFASLRAWDKPDFRLKDKDIVQAVVNNLESEEYEDEAILLMVASKIPNYANTLEERLLSGNSNCEDDIIYRLGELAESKKTLAFFKNRVREGGLERSYLNQALLGLRDFHSYGDEEMQNEAYEICQLIYKNDLIADEDYGALQEEYGYGNPALPMLEILFSKGDKPILRLAEDYVDSYALSEEALTCLIQAEGEKHRRAVVEKMKYDETYMVGLGLVTPYYNKTNDQRMLKSAITNFQTLYGYDDSYSDWQLEQLIDVLIETAGDSTENMLDEHLNNRKTKLDARAVCKIARMTPMEIADYFFENELIDRPLIKENVDREIEEGWGNDFYAVLEASQIYFWFDSEEYSPIGDYEYLIEGYRSCSRGHLEGLEFGVDNMDDNDSDTEFLAVLGDKAYRMYTIEADDWDYKYMYDFEYMINFILEDLEIEERFHSADYDGYVFGIEWRINQMIDDFRLYWEMDY